MNLGVMFGYRHADLNRFNRPVRTRMPGGVGGDRPVTGRPYPDQHTVLTASRLMHCQSRMEFARFMNWVYIPFPLTCPVMLNLYTLRSVAQANVVNAFPLALFSIDKIAE